MGCFQSKEPEPDDPMMEQFARTQDLREKAEIALALSTKEEQRGRVHKAVVAVGLWLACKAVELYKDYDRSQRKELVEVALACRRMATHRALLQQRAIRAAANVCFGPPYIPSDPSGPIALPPYQWNEFLVMAKGSGDVVRALEKMGVLEPQERPKLAPAPAPVQEEYDRPTFNINLPAPPQFVMPSININNSPNFSQTGPTTTIHGGNNDAHVAPTISSAQTGEGNVAPLVGPHAGASNAQSNYAPQTQLVDTAQSYFAPQSQKVLNEQSNYAPTAQAFSGALPAEAPPKLPPGYSLVPDGSGGFFMVPTGTGGAMPATPPAYGGGAYPSPVPQAAPVPMQANGGAPTEGCPAPSAPPPAAFGIPPPAPGTPCPLPATCGMPVPPPPLGYPQVA